MSYTTKIDTEKRTINGNKNKLGKGTPEFDEKYLPKSPDNAKRVWI